LQAVLENKAAENQRLKEAHAEDTSAKDRLKVNAQNKASNQEAIAAQTQMAKLADQMAFSTLHLSIRQMPAAQIAHAPPTYVEELMEAMGKSLKLVQEVVLVLAYLWPVLLLFILGFVVLRKKNFLNSILSKKSKTQSV